MEKPAQTSTGAPHRRRRRRPSGSGAPQAQQPAREGKPAPQNAPRQNNEPREPREGAPRSSRPRRGNGRPAQPQQAGQAQRQPAQTPRENRAPAQQLARRGNGHPAAAVPSQPLRDQPKAPRPSRNNRAQRRTVDDEPGLELIARRPPKQKFANFDDYLTAHGGMTMPLPDEPADTPEAEAPAPAGAAE